MDTLLLSSIRHRLGSAARQEVFDKAFGLPSLEGSDNILGSIGVLKKGQGSFLHPYDLLHIVGTKVINDDFVVIAAMTASVLSHYFCGNFLVRQRLKWDQHVRQLEREEQFKRMYRVSLASFNKLIDLLWPWLHVNLKQSCNASKGKQPIVAEIIMHCTLCYLAGGSVHNILVCAGLSVSLFYRAVQRGIDAINACPKLAFKFPITVEDLMKSASEFEQLRSHGVIYGCIGAMNG